MANEIRKISLLVTAPTKIGSGGGTATESPKKERAAAPTEAQGQSVPENSTSTPSHATSNTQLVIEKNEQTGEFIYKQVDRDSGEIIKQYPREDVLRSIAAALAAEGLVIDTEA